MQIEVTFEIEVAPNGDLMLIRVEQNHDYTERYEVARLDEVEARSVHKQLGDHL